MIDIKILRENPEIVKKSQIAREENPAAVDEIVELDKKYRDALSVFEEKRAEQNLASKEIATAPKDQKAAIIAKTKALSQAVKDAGDELAHQKNVLEEKMLDLQNVIEDAPAGSEEDFVVLKHVGEIRDFAAEGFEPKDHLAIAEGLKAIDVERGAKVSGTRFYYLTGIGARLELALLNMAVDLALKNGFTPMITPTLVRPEIMQGTGFTGRHDDEIYRLRQPDEQYLTGTSEVALAGFHKDEIIDLSAGSLRYAGWSACYRREAGSHGKDVRGIIRVHQFHKVEMFAYTKQEDSFAEHKNLLALEEEMLAKVELPYRVIDTAAGDLGSSAARKFDCEAWLPTQKRYLELTSTSNCTTFQARRLNIRYKGEDGKTKTAATLNGTLATTRWLVAILENHQQKDGSLYIPKALRPYLGGLEIGRVVDDAGE
jgi:seryl-tRNA synthetase